MIGKTRQPSSAELQEIFDTGLGKSRGILRLPPPEGKLRVSRHNPSPILAHCIAHYWRVSWDLEGLSPHVQETLPHPNIYLVFENGKLLIGGVSTSKFSRVLEGKSYAFGVKFKPGGFYPFLKSSVSALLDQTMPANRVFGKDGDALEAQCIACLDDEDKMVESADAFFCMRTPEPDEKIELATQLVERIFQERAIKTVDDLVQRTRIGKRTLQRIFEEYVGVNPKWVIRRYRLHEVVEKLNSGEILQAADLAQELGYFDQSHFINDFRTIVGYPPGQYQSLIQKNL